MDELVKLVASKTGMSESVARTAVETVISFLKQKLPAPVAGQLDSLLAGGGQDIAGKAGDALKGLGGLNPFGKK